MRERLLKTLHGQFVMREWDGHNRSGIEPVCDKVLVLVDPAAAKTSGGIIMTETVNEQQTLASTTGLLVAVGPQAFAYDSRRLTHWEGERPKRGMRVFFERYAGQDYNGSDGNLYRIMQDTSIGGYSVADQVEKEAVS
jgi:co-chaperonin GroES (HSP10)